MSPSPASDIPKIDPILYEWTPHPTVPRLYQRRALGPETKWAHQSSSLRQLYLIGRITFLSSVKDQSIFFQAAEKAWLRLRFEYPEVVQRHSGEFNADGSAIMQCEIPQNQRIAEDWVKRTFFTGTEPLQRAEIAPAEVEMRKREITDDPVSMLWHATYPQPKDPGNLRESAEEEAVPQLIGAEFCLRVDHGLADGMGAYILAGKYLKFVAEELGGRLEENIEWAKAGKNMPKAWVGMLNENQKTTGWDYEAGAKQNTTLVLKSMQSRWGLEVQSGDDYEPTSIHHAFSREQSQAILRSVKEKLGSACTVTYLGHAATVMTMLKFKPPQRRPSSQKHVVSPLVVNGRTYLDFAQPKSADHIPMCQAIRAVEFRDMERYILSEEPSKEEVQQKLKIACEEARRSYQRIREQDSLLTESFLVVEAMATAKNEVNDKGMADPLFLSDGIAERYTPRSYTDSTGSTQIFNLDDIRFTAVPDGPPLIIRMISFRDTIRLSAEWDAVCYPKDIIKRFLDNVMELMISFTDNEEMLDDAKM